MTESRLRVARLRARLTQTELAAKAGVSRTALSYVDRGAVPAFRVQIALADALGTRPELLWPVDTPGQAKGTE